MFYYQGSDGQMYGTFDGQSNYGVGSGLPGLTNTDSNYGFGTYSFLNPDSLGSYFDSIRSEQEKIWQREDSAYQRMVADMKKAGLNPWLGVSSSGLSTSTDSPTKSALSTIIQLLNVVNEATYKKDKNNQWIGNLIGKIGTAIIGAL